MKSLARSSGKVGISLVLSLLATELPAQEAYTPFGAGCAGSVGVPVILPAAPGNLPRIGNTFTVQLGNLPTGNGSGFVIFGFSRTDWAGIPLPADLSPFGLFGCTLYTSVDAAFPVMTSMGTAEFSLPIPNDPSLLAVKFFNQALVLDPGVNPFLGGAVVTNAAEGIIGPPGFDRNLLGQWTGTWMNTTFGSSGSIDADATEVAANRINVMVDLGGFVFGFVDPPPFTLDCLLNPDGTASCAVASQQLGQVDVMFNPDGSVTGSMTSIPVPGIGSMDFSGTIANGQLDMTYTVRLPDGTAFAQGKVSAIHL